MLPVSEHMYTIHSAGHFGGIEVSARAAEACGSGTVVVTGLHRISHVGVTNGRVVVANTGSGRTIGVARA